MILRVQAVIVAPAMIIPVTTRAQNILMHECLATLRDSDPTRRSAVVDPTDRIFPQIITGQGWETRMVLVNVGGTDVNFTEGFGDVNGNPMKVTFSELSPREGVNRGRCTERRTEVINLPTINKPFLVVPRVNHPLSFITLCSKHH